MHIEDSRTGQVTVTQRTDSKPHERFMRLILEPSRALKCLLRGMQLIIALSLASVAAGQSDLIMNGSSVYSDLGKDQFAAALYLETLQKNSGIVSSMQGEKRMEVRVLNNYSKRRWFNLWMQSISINNSRETFSESAEDLISLMQAAKSAPKRGDFIEYLSSPDQGTSMRFNGTELVTDLPAEVFGLLLNTWIGAIPPTTSFKDEILGKQHNPVAVELLETVITDPQRETLAASWILPPEPVVAKAKGAAPAKPKVTPAPIENKLPEAATAAATIAAVTTSKSAVTKQQSSAAKPTADADSANSKDRDLAKTSAETALASSDDEDEVDFSIAEALAMRDYTPLVVREIYKKIRYPSRAVDKGYEGTVRMTIVVSRSGALESVTITQESRHSMLNKAAIKATEQAAPFPELPAALNTDQFEITVPVTFKLE